MSKRESKSGTAADRSPWSVPVAVAEIPESGRKLDIAADEAARTAIAKVAGLTALPRLEAAFEVMRSGRDGAHVTGRVLATVGQNCVVTIEPIENTVDEAVDLVFAPPREPAAKDVRPQDSQVKDARKRSPEDDDDDSDNTDVDLIEIADIADPPEPLRDGIIDLGALAVEFLLLGIDPYPRKPGATFDAPAATDPTSHPFAALAALKERGGTKSD